MIAIDWGTSSIRSYRLDAAGGIIDQRSLSLGLLACEGQFDRLLQEQIEGWDDKLILLAGMIGSRSGWHEVPYLNCPTGVSDIAAGLHRVDAPSFGNRRIYIVPGLVALSLQGAPEVMRGEETQIMGLLLQLKPSASHTVCLPGTHSKWVQIDNERIISFRTAMTGELYALLRNQSLLSALMPNPPQDTHDDAAFAQGVADSARAGGLTHHLFGVRTQGLLGQLSKEAAPSYLSGLLIGHELRDLLPPSCRNVHLLGSAQLTLRYQEALRILGVDGHLYDDTISAIGLHRLAAHAMAISSTVSNKSLK